MARNGGIRVSVRVSLDGNHADSRMMRQGDQQRLPYQWVLRGIGAELDARGASQIMLLEGQDGFWVRFLGPDSEQGLQLVQMGYEELLATKSRTEGKRARQTLFQKQALPGGYQDFLRALGYELEQASAYSILIDEQDEDFLVTYQYLNSADGYVARMQMAVLDPSQRGALLQHAYARRQPHQKRSLLS
jgi:hypothetical protein